MPTLTGIDREQITFSNLESKIAKDNLKTESIVVIVLKGYHTEKELQSCQAAAIEAVVALRVRDSQYSEK
ncbi:MAG TPA: hypothetical protein PKC85_09910 [Bacteroidia bacterium]|jgi:hypothetical protein|nr:hypothetical protein [Bacteroidia bacterium]HMU20146.1 hypothetical protein [Bacteroidia bacterium]